MINGIPLLIPGCGASIAYSARLRGSAAPALTKTYTLAAPWTFSCWVKRSSVAALAKLLGTTVQFNAAGTLTAGTLTTTKLFRDTSAWMHIHVSNNGLYVNGTYLGTVATAALSNASLFDGFDGYVADVHLRSGTYPYTDYGGMTGGIWTPKSAPAGEHRLLFANAAAMGTNLGSGGAWTATNVLSTDQCTDTPTDDYATLDVLNRCNTAVKVTAAGTLYENAAGAGYYGVYGTLSASTGKVQFEVTVGASGQMYELGWVQLAANMAVNGMYASGGVGGGLAFAVVYLNYASAAYSLRAYMGGTSQEAVTLGTVAAGATITVLADFDAKRVEFRADGVSLGSVVLPNSNSQPYLPYVGAHWTNAASTVNFGQRPFAYPVAGYKPLSTANTKPSSAIASGTFTGNGQLDGPRVHCVGSPTSLTINGNAVTWGVEADRLANGFKIRTSATTHNLSGANSWSATVVNKMVTGECRVPNTAQIN